MVQIGCHAPNSYAPSRTGVVIVCAEKKKGGMESADVAIFLSARVMIATCSPPTSSMAACARLICSYARSYKHCACMGRA